MATKIKPHEKFYIEHNPDKLSIKELARMFQRPAQTVKNIQLEFKRKQEDESKDAKEEPKVEEQKQEVNRVTTGPNIGNLMTRHTRNGQVVSTVMTAAASERADDTRKNNRKPFSETLKSAIHKPRG